jgi:3-hydroxyacyl-[acyl-carrier-protein] dehydratase
LTEAAETNRDARWIQEILPHRYPLLLVDRVLELEPGKRIVALKNVTINEEFFVGHFPGHPVMPGVLLLEALAQAGGILLLHDMPDRHTKLLYFTGIEKARFRRPVVPGDQVRLEIDVLALRQRACRLQARATVDGKLATEAVLSSAMVDR